MKKIILLLTILCVSIVVTTKVYAKTYSDKFYGAEVIENIYYAKEKNGKIDYRKAIFKRRRDDNKIVYCLEPFMDMAEDTNYVGYDYNYEKLLNLSKEDWERIKLLSYYGYGYKNHTEEKWYPITQLLIWETIDKDAKFYYTKTYKGSKITKFTNETNELKKLVENHKKIPSFSNSYVKMSINSTLILDDSNKVLNEYKISNYEDLDIEINDNQLVINTNNNEKEIKIKLSKKDEIYNSIPVIYVSDKYQDILLVGTYEEITTNFTIDVGSGSLKIIKKDSETNTTIPQGSASLIDTKYALYDDENILIQEITIGENSEGFAEKLRYGDYKLIEIKSGLGYKLDHKEYYFNINQENKNIVLELTNEVIKSNIKIVKYTQDNDICQIEKNIKFQIINDKNEIFKEVETDENGMIEFDLPYGKYIVKQLNTTEGYYKVDDFEIIVDENSEKEKMYYLHDLKIPDTYEKKDNKMIVLLLLTLTSILVLKIYDKKYN